VKSISPPSAAKYSLDGDIFFLILLRKIRKKMSPSKEYFAAEGGKRQFTLPLMEKDNLPKIKSPLPAHAGKGLFILCTPD